MTRCRHRWLAGVAALACCTLAVACDTTGAQPQPSESIWAQRAPLLAPNSEIAAAEMDGKIYTIGGYPSTRVYVDTVQVYDSRTDQWEYSAPLPQPMHHTVAAAVNGILYVIGGEISLSGIANQGIYINTLYAFDPATGSWTERSPCPPAAAPAPPPSLTARSM
jgi:N-acetylneuraminic acid mutarotase